MRIFIGLALLAHALIHTAYLSPAPPRTAGGPEWPFEMSRSWLVGSLGLSADAIRPLGTVLVALTIVVLVTAGLSVLGALPGEWWRWLTVVGAVTSALTLALFFHPWIVLGFAIDAVLLYLVLVANWQPFGAAAP